MKFLFRVDGDHKMGLGHIMRCRALAEALIGAGHACIFAVAGLDPALADLLRSVGIAVERIDHPRDHDGALTLALAGSLSTDGLVVDGYHFDASWRAGLRRAGQPILAFADGPLRPDHADLLIDAASPPSPDPCQLFGPDYVLLRQELVIAAHQPLLPIEERRTILVTFGGADPAGLTAPTVRALHALLPDVALSVVIGGAVIAATRIGRDLARLSARISVHVAPSRLGDLMRQAGLAISAAGGTVGELAALGVPLVLAVVADNQVAGAEACRAAGWCDPIDARGRSDAAPLLAQAAVALWGNAAERAKRAVLARQTVNPNGAERAAAAFIQYILASKTP